MHRLFLVAISAIARGLARKRLSAFRHVTPLERAPPPCRRASGRAEGRAAVAFLLAFPQSWQ